MLHFVAQVIRKAGCRYTKVASVVKEKKEGKWQLTNIPCFLEKVTRKKGEEKKVDTRAQLI
ncbi:MAG: hypothetical protein QMD03_06415 [Syntrophales bacterium]|nr:hypothetical protein [Syntrophales bacterium]